MGSTLALSTLVSADASSHREAPLTSKDPVADNTDVYAFVDDDPGMVNLIANFQGFQEPGGGPNYFEFGDDVLYEIKVDNDGDAVEDVTYEFRFTTTTVDPNTFLYATGPIQTVNDETWNRPQEYTVTRVEDGQRHSLARNVRTAPSNVGPASTPDYESLAETAITDLRRGGGKVFAGQREEGFYVDIASIFDLGSLRPFLPNYEDGTKGIDTFAGYNVQSIALQVPVDDLTSPGEPVIGVWSTTSRQATRVFENGNGSQPNSSGDWVQVSRLGSPLVNEVVIPLGLKDAFNSLEPKDDAATLAGVTAEPYSTEGEIPLVQDPILGAYIEQIYGLDIPGGDRTDLIQIYLTGIVGLNQPANVQPAEMLRLNTETPTTPFRQRDPLGLLAGQEDGYPNGRRVGDDVVDIALRAVAGGTPLTPEFNEAPNNTLADGVDGNDRPYLKDFPYLATPHQGTDLRNPRRVVQ